jgi:hypothetical protein
MFPGESCDWAITGRDISWWACKIDQPEAEFVNGITLQSVMACLEKTPPRGEAFTSNIFPLTSPEVMVLGKRMPIVTKTIHCNKKQMNNVVSRT